jgi:hypothetical protein
MFAQYIANTGNENIYVGEKTNFSSLPLNLIKRSTAQATTRKSGRGERERGRSEGGEGEGK